MSTEESYSSGKNWWGGGYDLVTLSLLVGGCLMPYYCVCIGEVRMNSNGDREGEYVILATGEGEYVILATGEGEYPGHR